MNEIQKLVFGWLIYFFFPFLIASSFSSISRGSDVSKKNVGAVPAMKGKPPVKSEAKAVATTPVNTPNEAFIQPPPLAADEYAIFIEDKYIKFKTKKFEELDLDLSCFKGTIPKCEAYSFAQIKPKSMIMKHESLNNLAAIICESLHGRNLIALDSRHNEYNFCRYNDGSMVNSWSLYYKHFPQKK